MYSGTKWACFDQKKRLYRLSRQEKRKSSLRVMVLSMNSAHKQAECEGKGKCP